MNSTMRSLSIAAVAALFAAGCGGKSDAPAGGATAGAEEKVLNVYNWSDYIDPEVIRDFTRETGITVHYANGNSASTPYLDPAVANDPGVYPPPETMAKLFPNLARSQEFTRELNRTWTRFMTGK